MLCHTHAHTHTHTHIYIYNIYILTACISVKTAFLGLQLHNGTYNIAKSTMHVRAFMKMICFQQWWFNRSNT